MNDIMSRAFVCSRLSDGQIRALHAVEQREGIQCVPGEIHDRFNTHPFGEVSQEIQARVSPVIHAVWFRVEAQAKARQEFLGPKDYALFDFEIRKKGLNYENAGNGAREKLLKDRKSLAFGDEE